MSTVITRAGGYVLRASVQPIARQPGSVHLTLRSTLASAKDPRSERKVLDLVLDDRGAKALASLLTGEAA